VSFSSQFWFKYFLFKTSCSLRPSISHHVYFSKLNLSTFNIRFCECIIVVNFQFNFYLPFYSFFFLLFPLFPHLYSLFPLPPSSAEYSSQPTNYIILPLTTHQHHFVAFLNALFFSFSLFPLFFFARF